MQDILKDFLKNNDVLCLATKEPYCANLFYCFYEKNLSLLFISSPTSRHIKNALEDLVSVGIYTKNPIKGVQIQAILKNAQDDEKAFYLKSFKMARFALNHEVYSLKIKYLKYTDNTLLLPKKLEFINE